MVVGLGAVPGSVLDRTPYDCCSVEDPFEVLAAGGNEGAVAAGFGVAAPGETELGAHVEQPEPVLDGMEVVPFSPPTPYVAPHAPPGHDGA